MRRKATFKSNQQGSHAAICLRTVQRRGYGLYAVARLHSR
jgi:hypothetical protein